MLFLLIACFAVPLAIPAEDQTWDTEQETEQDKEMAEEHFPPKEMIYHPAELSEEEQKTFAGIFDSLDIGKEKKSWRIQLKQSDKPPSNNRKRFLPELPDFGELLGRLLRLAVGITLAAALLVAAAYAYRNRNRLFPALDQKSRAEREPAAEEPWQLLEEAETIYRAGKIRCAWALCFRAFTAFYALYFPLPVDATEYEALALARKNCGNAEGFATFVRRWVNFAYGGLEPKAEMFEEALASCRALLTEGTLLSEGALLSEGGKA